MKRLLLLALAACATAPKTAKPPSPAVEVVQRQVDAYNKFDLEGFVATYADDIVVTAAGKPVVQGKDALRERFQALFAKYPKNHAFVTDRKTEGDDVVLDYEVITGRGPDRPDPWAAGWVRYEVRNGSIQRVALP